ncbi:hypothetical protein, partial [Microbispora hainanensis]|uniref:hypothetical protein n=1 Tax=Microbispora hainanensis TaxID=568844 RepID=UPI00340757A2
SSHFTTNTSESARCIQAQTSMDEEVIGTVGTDVATLTLRGNPLGVGKMCEVTGPISVQLVHQPPSAAAE